MGSNQTLTNAGGEHCYDSDFYPFGGEKNYVNTCRRNYKFAAMERDGETGDDRTQFRQYASNLGRCPAGAGPTPVAGPGPASRRGRGDITNPQSLNRYAYVLNNPTNLIDPLGLDAGPYSLPVVATKCTGVIPYPYSAICANATATMNKMAAAATAANQSQCMAGEYGCGTGSSPAYGEDIFDALAGDSGTKVGVDANGNIGFTVNPDAGWAQITGCGSASGCSFTNLAQGYQPWNPGYTLAG